MPSVGGSAKQRHTPKSRKRYIQTMEYCAAHSDEDTTGQQISEERGKELSDGYERAYRVLRKATSVGAYIISDEVAEALASLTSGHD
jgi:hypothetical protein